MPGIPVIATSVCGPWNADQALVEAQHDPGRRGDMVALAAGVEPVSEACARATPGNGDQGGEEDRA
jgi:hypothetical protein